MRVRVDNSHVYLAQADDLVKVGVSYNLENRAKVLRRHGGYRFEIERTWPHHDPYPIEMMVIQSLVALKFERVRKECFRVPMAIAAQEVELALRCYDFCEMTNETPRSEVCREWKNSRIAGGVAFNVHRAFRRPDV